MKWTLAKTRRRSGYPFKQGKELIFEGASVEQDGEGGRIMAFKDGRCVSEIIAHKIRLSWKVIIIYGIEPITFDRFIYQEWYLTKPVGDDDDRISH